jgi:hypothetical protein
VVIVLPMRIVDPHPLMGEVRRWILNLVGAVELSRAPGTAGRDHGPWPLAVLRLRDERRIDDIVLRQIQTRLDIEEVRLSRRETVE